jgi:hypothetical protein
MLDACDMMRISVDINMQTPRVAVKGCLEHTDDDPSFKIEGRVPLVRTQQTQP